MGSIGIIGGGPAGLALAHDLAGRGYRVALFEAAPELGGLARSFRLGDIEIERYYHFLCADDHGYFRKAGELGLGNRIRWRATRMGQFHDGRLHGFSSVGDLLRFGGLSVGGRLRYGAGVFYLSRLRDWRRLDGVAAEGWLERVIGREAYGVTWYPLLHRKFGEHHDAISAAWVWHRVHRVARSRRSPLHRERLGYLEGGTEVLVRALEEELRRRGAELRPGTPVGRIVIEGGRATGVVTAGGEAIGFDRVVSAVPLPLFLRMAGEGLPADYRERLAGIDFLGVVCVTLRLRRRLSENFWLNVSDERVGFAGCIEYTNLNPAMTPDGTSIVYVPYYLPRADPRFRLPDDETYRRTLADLALIAPDLTEADVVDRAVSRDPYAQVVCPTGFADLVPPHRTPIPNLYLIESSQLYPSDRTISGTFDLAHTVADLISSE